MTDTITKTQSNAVLIAKFFELKGKEAQDAIKALTTEDKEQLGEGIRNETLTY
jgi:hypothetical protein